MNKNLFVCKTTWEHFVTILYSMNHFNETGNKSAILVEEANENILFWEKLKNLECFNEYKQIKLIQNRAIKFILFKYRTKISLYNKLKKYINDDYIINVFVDQSVISQTFFKHNVHVNLFEHGNGNYLVGAYPNFPLLKKLLGVTPGYGRSDFVKNIYLQYPEKSPIDIKEKVKKLDITAMFENLKNIQKKRIFELFSIPKNIDKDSIIILTQPLSEDGFMSEAKKISIYRDIIKTTRGKQIYIKPHPRDTTNYLPHFKNNNIIIFSKSFPIEILNFSKMEFDKVITVCSGAAYNFNYPINVEIIGTEIYPELIKPLGIIKSQILSKDKYQTIDYI